MSRWLLVSMLGGCSWLPPYRLDRRTGRSLRQHHQEAAPAATGQQREDSERERKHLHSSLMAVLVCLIFLGTVAIVTVALASSALRFMSGCLRISRLAVSVSKERERAHASKRINPAGACVVLSTCIQCCRRGDNVTWSDEQVTADVHASVCVPSRNQVNREVEAWSFPHML